MYLDKLEERFLGNRRALEEAAVHLQSMMGEGAVLGSSGRSRRSVEAVLDYLGVDRALCEVSDLSVKQIEDLLSTKGYFSQHIRLEGRWWSNTTGAILTTDSNSELVAAIPTVFGYSIPDHKTGKFIKAGRKNVSLLSRDAVCFHRSLGDSPMTLKQFLRFTLNAVPVKDYFWIIVFCITSTLLCMLTPVANKILFNEVIPSGITGSILPIACLLLGAGISAVLFNICRNFLLVRVKDKINTSVQPALMARMLRLPSSFFKKYSSGELSQRVLSVNSAGEMLTHQILGTFAGGLFAVMYVLVAFVYAQDMVWVVFVSAFLMLAVCVPVVLSTLREYDKKTKQSVVTRDFTFNVISGIHKIKNNRAEYRVFAQWAKRFSKSEPLTSGSSFAVKYRKGLGVATLMLSTFLCYFAAWKTGIALSDYIAFMSAMGLMLASIDELHRSLDAISRITPQLKLLAPILETCPENVVTCPVVPNISGSIDINHVSFFYSENSPKVLDDISLHIPAGQSIGLVGASGCGKSTLMRLMLGFEKPTTGSIFYGQYNVEDVNLSSLRQFVGFCPQSNQIFPGTIKDNIKLSSPNASLDDIWEAARIACLDEDIRRMPAGMDTLLGEGGSGLSGGQCQRILIARAVINRPMVLFLDEATSALDNITQRKVVENLSEFGCTRISIAHRLSTVMFCDRIIALKGGKIIEDGSPEELMKKRGYFYQLSIRQQ